MDITYATHAMKGRKRGGKMGDRYHWEEPCPKCGELLFCYYAESCEYTDVTCQHCNTEFDIKLEFVLEEKVEDARTTRAVEQPESDTGVLQADEEAQMRRKL